MIAFWSVLFILAPLPLLIIYGRIKILLQRRAKLRTEAADPTPKPFAPLPEPTPHFLLRRFAPVERHYLRQQFSTARAGLLIVLWIVFAILAGSLLPANVNLYGMEAPLAQRVWYSFLHTTFLLASCGIFLAIVTAITAAFGITGTAAIFNRTRPIAYRFLFWGRVLPAIATLLAGYAAAVLLSFALLVVVYGPVWNHLFVAGDHRHLPTWRVLQLVSLLQSPATMFVSIAASMLLVFSLLLLLICQPYQPKLPKPLILASGFGFFELYSVFGMNHVFPRLAQFGLTTSGSNLPPPLATYLIPLALSAGLLFLAQISISRNEA